MKELFEKPMPTIPKVTAKSSTGSFLGQVFSAARSLASEGDWEWLFAIPQLLLWKTAVKFTAEYISQRILVLLSGNINSLVTEWRSGHHDRAKGKGAVRGHIAATRSNDKTRSAAMSALSDGYPGVALRRLDPKPILEPEAALHPLEKLHPPEQEPVFKDNANRVHPLISAYLAICTLKKMPSISAPGCSGLRPSHMRSLFVSAINATKLATVLTLVANGKGPEWLRNARLIAIAKENGGLRPIAIG